MDYKSDLKELLLKLSYQKRNVTLSSGLKSDFYIDVKQTSLHVKGAHIIGKLFFEVIQKEFPQIKAIGGPTLGADPLVSATSLASFESAQELNAFIIRKEPKGHGTGAWIEGVQNLEQGMPVVIVEDVLTTGKSGLLGVEKARDFGLDVQGFLTVVDREEGGRENVEKHNLKVFSLVTKSYLLGA